MREIAFLYKLQERDKVYDELLELQGNYILDLPEKIVSYLKGIEGYGFEKALIDFFEKEAADEMSHDIIGAFDIDLITTNCAKFLEKNKKLDDLMEFIDKEILESADERLAELGKNMFKDEFKKYFECYFKDRGEPVASYEELKKSKIVYFPPDGVHSWHDNLLWLLEHMHRNSTFIIMSEVNEYNKKRREDKIGGSGFFREVATCYCLGYIFIKTDNNELIMEHPDPESLKKLTIDLIQFDIERMESEYVNAIKDFNRVRSEPPSLDCSRISLSM